MRRGGKEGKKREEREVEAVCAPLKGCPFLYASLTSFPPTSSGGGGRKKKGNLGPSFPYLKRAELLSRSSRRAARPLEREEKKKGGKKGEGKQRRTTSGRSDHSSYYVGNEDQGERKEKKRGGEKGKERETNHSTWDYRALRSPPRSTVNGGQESIKRGKKEKEKEKDSVD